VEGDATCCWEPNGGSVESRSLPEIARGVNQKARRDYEDAGGERGQSAWVGIEALDGEVEGQKRCGRRFSRRALLLRRLLQTMAAPWPR
jgi:hypothetical protein